MLPPRPHRSLPRRNAAGRPLPPGRPRPPGFSLPELVTVLALLAASGAPALGAARRLADRWAVEGAREEMAALLGRARSEAVLRGEAVVVVSRSPARARLIAPAVAAPSGPGPRRIVLQRTDPGPVYRVRLDPGGGRGPVELRFGPTGVGQMTSRTLTFSRGRARARLVLSSYGRLRRP